MNGCVSRFRRAGWNALPFDHDYGGHGLRWLVAMRRARQSRPAESVQRDRLPAKACRR
jgi:hypothetical protein